MSKQGSKTLVPELRFSEFRDAAGWADGFLGSHCVIKTGKLDANAMVENGQYRFYTCAKNYYFIDEYAFDTDALLISGNGENVGYIHHYNGKFNAYQRTYVLDKFSEDIVFIKYFLEQSLHRRIAVEKKDGNTPYIVMSTLTDMKINLPAKAEQQKIADCLSSLDELITAETQQLATLKAHKKGLMQQLFPAEGETVPKLRLPEFCDAPEWGVFTLGQMGKFRRGSFPQPYGLPEWFDDENGYPFIQVYDVGNDLKLKPKTKSKISKLAAAQSVFIPKETLIVTLQGSIGRVAITQYDAYIDRTLLLFEEFFKPTDKLFFAYIIQNLFEIEKEKAPGGIIKTITKEDLTDFKIKHPTLSEQQKIADCLSSMDNLIATQTQKLAALKTHKKGLMQQLFPSADEVSQ